MTARHRNINTNYNFPVTANLDLDDYKWVWEQAKKLNISKAEVLRRCINYSKRRKIFKEKE